MDVSLVIPVYNEEENIAPLCREVSAALDTITGEVEAVLVDDGSSDQSFTLLARCAADDTRLKVVRLRRNFGQTAALAAGIAAASGAVLVTLDADLQNDPADIPRMLAKMDEGFDVVSGWRRKREDAFVSRKLPSLLANRLISVLTGVALHDYGCTLKAYRREVLEHVNLYGELHRFVPALASQVGAKITEMEVNHRPRLAGTSKYGIDRTLRVVLDLITVKFLLNYATRPMQLFGKWGFGAFCLGGIAGATVIYMKFFDSLPMNRNPLTILSAFLFFTAIQFIVMGLLGELMTRTYHEVQNKPVYTVRETVNL